MGRDLGGGIREVTEEQKEDYRNLVELLSEEFAEEAAEEGYNAREVAKQVAYDRLGYCPDCWGWTTGLN